MTYPYRCTRGSCRKYVTLKKRKEEYAKEKVCPVCGGRLSLTLQMRKRDRRLTCRCDGYPYPHKKTTSVWCTHHPTDPTDEDWRDRYG